MILVTSKETGLPAYIWVKEIQNIEKHGGSSPFCRVFLQNEKAHHAYFLDVTESEKDIQKKIKYERLDPGCEVRAYLEMVTRESV